MKRYISVIKINILFLKFKFYTKILIKLSLFSDQLKVNIFNFFNQVHNNQ